MIRLVLPLAVVLAAVASPSPARAQGPSLGLKGGFVSSDLKLGGNDQGFEDFWDRKTGLAGGAFLSLGGGPLGLQVEGMYLQQGVKGDFEGASGEFKAAYIEIPALLRLSMATGSLRPYAFGGPAVALEMSCEVKATFEGTTFQEDCDSDALNGGGGGDRRTTLFGAVVGGGVQFGLPDRLSFLVEVRYSRGLQSLDKSDETDIKHEAIGLHVGIAFPLSRR